MDVKDDNGDTPLHLAASQGRLLALFTLVKRGASTSKSNKRGKTPKDMMKRPSGRDDRSMQLFRRVSMVWTTITGEKVVYYVVYSLLRYVWL